MDDGGLGGREDQRSHAAGILPIAGQHPLIDRDLP
jgi:hypothetical protein